WTPVVLDDMSKGNRFALRYGPFYEGAISNRTLVRQIVEEHNPVGAILFAGFINVGESTGNPRKYFRNNITEPLAFLDALLDAGLSRVVFSSSAAVYGMQERMPISEDDPKDPISPYA